MPRHDVASRRRVESVILFTVGPFAFAISAIDVDEIREPIGLSPLPPYINSKVKYTLHRNGHDYMVVDSSFYFQMLPSKVERVLVLRNRPVVITTGSVARMAEIDAVWALPNVFKGEERRWYRGLSLIDGNVVPVVNAENFLTEAELAKAYMVVKGASA